jgi:hypothetical protein
VSNGSNELYSYNFSTESYSDLGHLNAGCNVTASVAVPELDRFTMINLERLRSLGRSHSAADPERIQC